MEKNSKINQPNSTLNWIFRVFQISPIFRSLYFKICWVLDKTLNINIVALGFIYKFYFDQNLSLVQRYRAISAWKSTKQRSLTKPFWQLWNSNFRSKFLEIPWESEKTPNMKNVDLYPLYNFCVYRKLRIAQTFGVFVIWKLKPAIEQHNT